MFMEDTETLVSFEEWKSNLLAEIESQPDTVAKGDLFVQKVLQMSYGFSEEDAVNATSCAGPGDRGVDAVYIFPANEDDIPRALVVQGKYGTAGTNLQILQEAQKFIFALKSAQSGVPTNDTIEKLVNLQKHGGIIRYLIATVGELNKSQQKDLNNTKKIAYSDFSNSLIIEAINIKNIYDTLDGVKAPSREVDLPCQVVAVTNDVFVGVTSLADMYSMLRSYGKQSSGTIDTIYDRNIRKYIKRRAGSVNEGIWNTLENDPSHFIAYNNGITIICQSAIPTEANLRLVTPYIVNGCQTTRTLYDVMDKKFSGINPLNDTKNAMASYKEAFMAIKVLVVKEFDSSNYGNEITRFSNKQNAIKGKDFIALETIYRKLKEEMLKMEYFLEIQVGEYEALPKYQQKKYPKGTRVINSFEATLCYGAGLLGKPHIAFGHSSDFAPGGEEFEKVIENLTPDDLLIPWMIARYARELGYTDRTQQRKERPEEHRIQTRHLFLFVFFRLFKDVIIKLTGRKEELLKNEIYQVLKILQADHELNPQSQHPLDRLLSLSDETVAIFMTLAETEKWYTDRNAFLRSKESIKEEHIIQAITAAKLKVPRIAEQIKLIIENNGNQ